jgi:hypothetical protein
MSTVDLKIPFGDAVRRLQACIMGDGRSHPYVVSPAISQVVSDYSDVLAAARIVAGQMRHPQQDDADRLMDLLSCFRPAAAPTSVAGQRYEAWLVAWG